MRAEAMAVRDLVRDLNRDAFVETFGGVFEHSPWVAEGAWDGGLDESCNNADGLHARFCAIVRRAPADAQLHLLRAHPDLAGKLALAGEMTADSKREQAGAGLSSLTADELAAFTALNEAYVKKFRFPFIIAVRGLDKLDILREFRRRVGNTPEAEHRAALEQVERIALLRMRDLMA
jgi:2-oxo-4-hydroxy-4-carboxy-5-ureidoimidazoline decarboxylase